MTIGQMRERVTSAYSGRKWKNKVNKMSDAQIVAIYYSLKEKSAPPSNKPQRGIVNHVNHKSRMYYICDECGATLDSGEVCDCRNFLSYNENK